MGVGNDSGMTPGGQEKSKKRKKQPKSLSPEKSEEVNDSRLKLTKSLSFKANRPSNGIGEVTRTGEASSAKKRKRRSRSRKGTADSSDNNLENDASDGNPTDDDAEIFITPKIGKHRQRRSNEAVRSTEKSVASCIDESGKKRKHGKTSVIAARAANASTTAKPMSSGETAQTLTKSQKPNFELSPAQSAAGTEKAESMPEPSVEVTAVLTGAQKRRQRRKSSKSKEPAVRPAPVPVKAQVEGSDVSMRIEEDDGAVPTEFAITKEQVEGSVKALLESLKHPAKKGQKPQLFEDTVKPIYLQIAVIRVPKGDATFATFNLPNKPVTENAEVCLIIKDEERGLKVDHEEHVAGFKRKVESAGLSGTVTEVLSLRQLKVEYKTFEAKRKLQGQYDVFLVDQRIFFRISGFLSKFFYETDKLPVPVKLDKPEKMKRSVEKALRISLLPLRATGTTLQMLVGNTSMSRSDLADNVFTVVERLNDEFIGGFRNIRKISVRTEGSVSVPIYVSLLTRDEVRPPVLESKVKQGTVVGDLSTLRGGEAVVVEAEGNVRIIPNPKYKPTPLDEEEFYQSEVEESEEESEDEDEDERPKKKSKKQKKTEKGKEPKKVVNQEKQKKKVESVEVPMKRDIDESDSEVDMEEERYLNNRERAQDEEQSEEGTRKEKKKDKPSKDAKGGVVKPSKIPQATKKSGKRLKR